MFEEFYLVKVSHIVPYYQNSLWLFISKRCIGLVKVDLEVDFLVVIRKVKFL